MKQYHLWLLIIIFIALALRLHNLTYHSLWFDEAISVYWARQTVPRILEVGFTLVEDRLPPLYYLMLKGWTNLVGFSETGVRSLSVLFGVLLVPVLASIAASLFNRPVALVTAALAALNPFLIWYSQEARMYAPAVLFGALSVWACLRFCQAADGRMEEGGWKREGGRGRMEDEKKDYTSEPETPSGRFTLHVSRFTFHVYLLLFTLFAIASLYSHLYAGFLLPALGLWLMLSYPGRWRLWVAFAGSALIISLAFAPLALATWRFSGEAVPGHPFTQVGQRLWWLLQAFSLWKAPLPASLQIAIPTLLLFFVLAAYVKPYSWTKAPLWVFPSPNPTPAPFSTKNPLLLITLLLVFPFIIASLLLLRNYLAFFGERYFIIMVPWLLLLAAKGAVNMSMWVGMDVSRFTFHASRFTFHVSRFTFHISRFLPPLLLITLTALPIPGQWSIPAAKEAWRQSVAYLAEHAAPDHGILIHPDWVRYPFQFYFRGPGQTYAAFSDVTPETPLDGPLAGVIRDHPVIWLIQSHLDGPDPSHLVEGWFAARYPLVTELYPPGISLTGYAPGYQLDRLPAGATAVDLQFENGLRLVGYQADRQAAATDELFHPPSGWVHVTLYWTAAEQIDKDAAPFVNLVGPEGVWGASLERANDALKIYPPSRWPVEQVDNPASRTIIRHDLDVNLNPLTPPGRYQLVVGLQGYETQHPLTEVEIR